MFKWLAALSVGFSITVNTMIGGDRTMTVSARAGHAREHGSAAGRRVCHVLNWIDLKNDADKGPDHCDNAMAADARRNPGRQHEEPVLHEGRRPGVEGVGSIPD